MRIQALLTTLTAALGTTALDNGRARTPPLGWNSWNAVRCVVNETIVRAAADSLVATGLAKAGFEYIVLDDCWQDRKRSSAGALVAHPTKFPSGIAALAAYVKSKGLKFGIYSSPGTRTCAMIYDGYPATGLGSMGHEALDAQTFAAWGVEYLKYDWCLADQDGLEQRAAFAKMRDCLAATGKAITYSISEYGYTKPWTWAAPVANLWRTTADIQANWASVARIIDSQAALAGTSAPGAWNDPDMLQIGNGKFTPAETRAHVAMWAMFAAPLMIGTVLDKLPAATLAVLTNPRLLAIDQDRLGRQAARVQQTGGVDLWVRDTVDGQAFAVWNTNAAPATITIALGDSVDLVDVWTGAAVSPANSIKVTVQPHDALVYTRKSPKVPSIALA